MSHKLKALAVAAAAILLTGPALAQRSGDPADHRGVGVPEANATITGTEEKTLVDKQDIGHYSVCSQGSHALTVSYDKNSMDIASGDCAAVQASKISVKGTNANAYNKTFIYNHTHVNHVFHPNR